VTDGRNFKRINDDDIKSTGLCQHFIYKKPTLSIKYASVEETTIKLALCTKVSQSGVMLENLLVGIRIEVSQIILIHAETARKGW